MGYKARWGPMGFLVSPNKIVPFDNFSTSITLKTDNGNDTSGTSASNTRGLELQPMTFTTKYMRAAGVDPLERFNAWKALIGKSHPLYIGSKRFGPSKMRLKGISVSELLTNNNGAFLSITLDITLEEYSSASSSGTKKKDTTASKASSVYEQTVAKKKAEAMDATASADDRNNKKLSTMEKRLG